MTYPLPPAARAWQAKVREFVDQDLIPWEVHAEMHNGEIPPEERAKHVAKARALGISNMAVPKALGGGGLSLIEQAVVQEQFGRVTNALSWCTGNVQPWMLNACSPEQIETWVKPNIAGRRHECYAITEPGAGSDVDAIEATARRDGDSYVLNGEKWHVTSANHADHFIFQAKLTEGPHAGSHSLFFVDMGTPGVEMVRSPAYSHTYAAHHPIYRFRDVRVPAANRIGAEGAGRGDRDEHAFRVGRILDDGMEAHPAGPRRPVRARAVLAETRDLGPALPAVGGAEESGILDAGVHRVGVSERRLQVPDPLELPGMSRAVVPLVRAGNAVVGELVAHGLPGLAPVVGALDHLAEPAAGLGGVEPVRIGG